MMLTTHCMKMIVDGSGHASGAMSPAGSAPIAPSPLSDEKDEHSADFKNTVTAAGEDEQTVDAMPQLEHVPYVSSNRAAATAPAMPGAIETVVAMELSSSYGDTSTAGASATPMSAEPYASTPAHASPQRQTLAASPSPSPSAPVHQHYPLL